MLYLRVAVLFLGVTVIDRYIILTYLYHRTGYGTDVVNALVTGTCTGTVQVPGAKRGPIDTSD